VGLVLAAMRQVPQQMAELKAGRWQIGVGTPCEARRWNLRLRQDRQRRRRLRQAFGMNVLVWAREDSLKRAHRDGHAVATGKAHFFSECRRDFAAPAPRRRNSRHRDSRDLALMKPTALLVNTSRAPLIEAGALVAALKAGRPGMAAVDVYEEEPLLDTRIHCSKWTTSCARRTSATSRATSTKSSFGHLRPDRRVCRRQADQCR
jgi:D-3-phosphoglycerate dehydrogenase